MRFSQKSIFVLMYKEGYLVSNDNNLSLPSVFQSLLQEFEDMFQDEVPKELPPIRGTEHQVNFIPGSVIPNKPAYRANPTKTKRNLKASGEAHEEGLYTRMFESMFYTRLISAKER